MIKMYFKLLLPLLFLLISCYDKSGNKEIEINGNLEFTEIQINSEISGKIDTIFLNEGDRVKKDTIIAKINSDILKAQLWQAQANLRLNNSKLQSLESGARTEEINQAKTLVEQAKETLIGSKKSVENNSDLYKDRTSQKQLLDNSLTQYEISKEQFEMANHNLLQAKEQLNNNTNNYLRLKDLYEKKSISKQQFENSETQLNISKEQVKYATDFKEQSRKNMEGLKVNYQNVKKIYDNRIQQKQLLDNSVTQEKIAETNLKLAKEKLNLITSPAKKEDLNTLKAAKEQAMATVKLAEIQLSKAQIKSPINGTIILKNFEEGEIVSIGSPLFTIADISQIWLKVYIPEIQIGYIKLGQKVNVKVDSFPDKTFEGVIRYISSKAEFTPKNVQTKEERVNQVFEVKIFISNKESLLKSGMPADAQIIL